MPIVYNSNYNITACGLERCHPFDSTKYLKVYTALKERGIINDSNILFAKEANRKLLLMVHSPLYLLALCYSLFIVKCIEVPVCFLPSCLLRWRVLRPMLYATHGSVLASIAAVNKGWGINLAGGYHHASGKSGGGGFCVYADITIIVKYLKKYHQHIQKIMIIDTDAHQGNGHERDFIDDKDVFICDFYNPYIYPGDHIAMRGIRKKVHITPDDSDESYFEKLHENIKPAIEQFSPQFIIYNAGTDCMQNDPLGGLCISHKGIEKRDEIIFQYALQSKIPIVMLLSGGYQITNAPAIADSITNLVRRFQL